MKNGTFAWSVLSLAAIGGLGFAVYLALKGDSKGDSGPEPNVVPSVTMPPSVTTSPTNTTPAPAPTERPAKPPVESSKLGVVLAGALNVRSGPGVQHERSGVLFCGDVVDLLGKDGTDDDWFEVRVKELHGWSHSTFLVPLRAGGQMPECRNRPAPGPNPTPAPQTATKLPAPKIPVEPAPEPPPAPTPAPGGGALSGVGVVPPLPPAPRPPGPAVVSLSRGGVQRVVSFPHHKHNSDIGLGCINCHHSVKKGDSEPNRDKACRDCHKPGGQPVSNKDAFHTTCINCHKAQAAGPTKCAQCHAG